MEVLIQITAVFLAVAIVLIRKFSCKPNTLSAFELNRRAEQGDQAAMYEEERRRLLPALAGVQTLKYVLTTALLAALLLATHEWWIGLLMLVGYLLVTEIVVAKGWLDGVARALQAKAEPLMVSIVAPIAPLLAYLAPKPAVPAAAGIASREDLADMIARDTGVLADVEKARLLGALHFDDLKVDDVMVPRDQIITVGIGETVGPLLLDRLHKVKHKIFVVVKKDLDHIKGLLYMNDILEPHPDLKTVKDAVRPSVYYVAGDMPLSSVLAASLQSGRQLFIVVDDNGNTQGLITLRDALVKLMGTAPPDEMYTSTDPKKVKTS